MKTPSRIKIPHVLSLRLPPEILNIMQHLLIEDLDLVRLVAKKDSSHLLSGLYIVLELVGSQLSLQISKYILNGRELRSVARIVKHLEPVLLYHLHYLRVLV